MIMLTPDSRSSFTTAEALIRYLKQEGSLQSYRGEKMSTGHQGDRLFSLLQPHVKRGQ
jgi:hypothetical protein